MYYYVYNIYMYKRCLYDDDLKPNEVAHTMASRHAVPRNSAICNRETVVLNWPRFQPILSLTKLPLTSKIISLGTRLHPDCPAFSCASAIERAL